MLRFSSFRSNLLSHSLRSCDAMLPYLRSNLLSHSLRSCDAMLPYLRSNLLSHSLRSCDSHPLVPFFSHIHCDLGMALRLGACVGTRHMTELVKPPNRVNLVDSFALVEKLEAGHGNPKQSQVMIEVMLEVLNDSIENLSAIYVSKHEMEKSFLEVHHKMATMRTEIEKMVTDTEKEIYKLKAEVEGAKYEVVKYSVGTLVAVAAVGLGVIRLLM